MPIGYWDSSANNGSGCYVDSSSSNCTPLDAFGNGDYNGLTYSNGDPAQGYYSSIPGSAYSNTYFLSGSATSLNSSGTGSYNNTYYIGGSATSLDSCGNGSWNGTNYVDGSASNSAWSSCANQWWYNGAYQSGVDSYGNGYAMSAGYYFIAGAQTTLDMMGNGFWSGHAYYSGSLQPTGWNGTYYYISDQQTTLDSSGNGTWNGTTYSAGVAQIVGTKFVGSSSGNFDSVSNWTDAGGAAANLLPDGNSAITVVGDVTANMSNAASSVPGLTVSGQASFQIPITVTSGGTAVFTGSASLGSGGSITGDAEFRDSAYMASGSSVTGNVTFRGKSVNKNDISGTVTGSHGGGINGSNILGFA